jgi:serine/threonine protein kinase
MMPGMGERQFGPYRLVQQIAVGGMAEIHLAKTHGIAGFEKYVVLKMIHPNFSQDHQFIQMLIDEAKITVQLQHVNIAQTFDLGKVGDTFYITMEYVDGADLYKLLRKTAELDRLFPIPVAAFIGKEVASGLDYAHRKRDHNGASLGIVHRDVSPQNILISYAGEVKLVDFGIAKATMRNRQTAAGVIKGKYYYMSPEQAWGEPLDHRTDIFSAGILLYETLTGQMLYLEEDLHKLLDMVRRAHIPPPSTLRKEIPAQLDTIVMRALAKRQEDRYQHAAELANDLERFLHSYAPVFTANKVAAWILEVLGQAAAPTLMGLSEKPEPERDRGETRRLTREQLVQARSDFTDENSIIFAFGERESTGTGGGPTSTDEAPLTGDEEDDVDSLPGPPRDQEPIRRTPAPAATHSVVPVTVELAARAPERIPPHVEPVLRRRLPGVTSESQASSAADLGPATRPISRDSAAIAPSPPRSPDQETRQLSGPAPAPPPRPSVKAPAVVPRPAAPRTADLAARPGRGLPYMSELPNEGEEDSSAGSPDDATIISDAPSWWSGPGDHTEVAETPFHDAPPFLSPPPGDVDQEAPTLLKANPVKGQGPPASWEPAPALAASVPQPAISAIKPARVSRRTPAAGITSSQGENGRMSSVLASLLAPESRVPAVALSPPTPSSEHPTVPARPRPPSPMPAQGDPGQPGAFSPPGPGFPGPAMPAQDFSTRAMAAALERDEIPDQYKIRRRSQPTPWLIGLGALILSAAVAAMLLAIYGTGGGEAAGGDAVLRLISIPPGATVTVDGQALAERTPTAIRGAPGERLLVGFELARFQREEQEFIVPAEGGEHQVVARLDPVVVKLTIESQPPGAEVFIGGNSVGRTPLQLPGLDPQSTTSIELRLKGHRPVRQTIDWSEKTEQRLLIPLTP